MKRSLVALTLLSLGLMAAEPPLPPVSPSPVTPAPAASTRPNIGETLPQAPQGGRVWLGVILEEGASFDGKPQPKVTRVIPGSTAEKLGLQPGDQLLQLGETPLTSVDSFRAASTQLKVGETLTAKILRGTQNLDMKATIEAPPRPRDVLTEADKIKAETADLRLINERAATTSRLEELLTLLNTVQKGLPESAAEFKKVYPKGRVNIQIKIDIQSDPTGPEATPLPPATVPAKSTVHAEVLKPEDKKPEDKKPEDKKADAKNPSDQKPALPAAVK